MSLATSGFLLFSTEPTTPRSLPILILMGNQATWLALYGSHQGRSLTKNQRLQAYTATIASTGGGTTL
jgi:hypothetical protein